MVDKKQIYKKAYSLLSRRDYSVVMMRNKLREFALGDSGDSHFETLLEDVIEDLKEKKWLSDERLVSSFLNSKGQLYGEKRIWLELKKLGIGESLIEKMLETTEGRDADKARVLLGRKFKGKANSIKEKVKRRDYLMRRGFSYGVCNKLVLQDE